MKLPVDRKLRYKVIAGALLLVVTFTVFLFHSCGQDSEWIISGEDKGSADQSNLDENETSIPSKEVATTAASITVDLAGEVRKPGVYILSAGSRVYQVIDQAGGLTEKADTRNTNLAAVLSDGTKLYIPSKEDVIKETEVSGQKAGSAFIGGNTASSAGTSTGQQADNALINLNTASSEDLQNLPGVGPATAEKILSYRKQYGGFSKKEQLMDVSGIGEKTFSKLEALICI